MMWAKVKKRSKLEYQIRYMISILRLWYIKLGYNINIYCNINKIAATMGDKENNIDAEGEQIELNYDESTSKGEIAVKVICLGDSAVGKSK